MYLSELILKVSFILFVSSSHMESYCDSDYRTAVGETYYLKLIKSEIENIPVPHQEYQPSEEYIYTMKARQKDFPTTLNDLIRLQKSIQ